MAVDAESYHHLKQKLDKEGVALLAVSKMQTVEAIRELYSLGQRDFGENYVQELLAKKQQLPADINWHFIGHLQTNKVKQIVGSVQLIQAVDSLRLLKEINRQARNLSVVQDCLLQVHIAKEETKFGFDEEGLRVAMESIGEYSQVRIRGLMGMASLTEVEQEVRNEFNYLRDLFNKTRQSANSYFDVLSMGMSGDYEWAIEAGSNMVRIGSLLFGARR